MTQTTFEQGLDIVADLAKRFSRNAATYRNPEYDETRSRIEFINPFFDALGYDKARHDRMVKLVEQMLELHKQQAAASASDHELYQCQIDATDRD